MPLAKDGSGTKLNKGVTTIWQLGAWYPGNYPKAVTFYQQRLCFGGSPFSPQTLWFSTLGNFETFSPTDLTSSVLATSGFSYKIASSQSNEIVWMDSSENLLVGTSASEWRVTAATSGEALTPVNIKITQQTTFGSSDIQAQRVGDSVIFVQAPGKVVRELSYSYDSDSFKAINLSVIADHLFDINSPVAETSYLKYPHNQLFFRTGAGDIYSMTYEKEQQVVGYSRLFLGGYTRRNDAPDAKSGTIDDWVTSTSYDHLRLVIKDGCIFESLVKHTSDSFYNDYTDGKWVPRGPSVMSICSLPSPYDLKSDCLYIASFRNGLKRDNTTGVCTATSDYLCFEFLAPAGEFSVDTPTQKRIGELVGPMDMRYNRTGNDAVSADASVSTLLIAKTELDPYMPISLGSGYYIDVSIVIYGNDGHACGLYVEECWPKSGGFCRLTESGSNYIVTAYDSSGSTTNILPSKTYTRAVRWSIGFPFHAMVETLPLETIDKGGGTTMGRVRRINELTLNLDNSGDFSAGTTNLDLIDVGDFTFSGQKTFPIDSNYNAYEGLKLISNSPHLLNILSLSPELTINR